MTEDEAKKKWCPLVKSANGASHGKAMSLIGEVPNICIASHCMMWRWIQVYSFDDQQHVNGDHGYCGLAGKL